MTIKKEKSTRFNKDNPNFTENGIPSREGVYFAINIWGDNQLKEIDVYEHPVKGLASIQEDFGSWGSGVDDKYNCHVSVQNTGLEFVARVGDLK